MISTQGKYSKLGVKRYFIPLLLTLLFIAACALYGCEGQASSPKSGGVTDNTPSALSELDAAIAKPSSTQAPETMLAQATEPMVAIYVGNALHSVYPLSKEDSISIALDGDKLNIISISDGSVFMSFSTCQNQDCVEQSPVTLENYNTRVLNSFIICLPNTVTIELVPGPQA